MALNALKFRIAIEDHASAELVRIESALKNLKDKDIKVNVEGLKDLTNLLETLKGSNSPTSNVGEKLAKEVETATAALKQQEKEVNTLNAQVEKLQKTYERISQLGVKFQGKDLEKELEASFRNIRHWEYELEKQLSSVFSNAFKNVKFGNLASDNFGFFDSANKLVSELKNAMANGNKKEIEKFKQTISTQAVANTFRLGSPDIKEEIHNLEQIANATKKNSIEYKAAQYALEQYRAALASIQAAGSKKTALSAYDSVTNAANSHRELRREIDEFKQLSQVQSELVEKKNQLEAAQKKLAQTTQQLAQITQQSTQATQQESGGINNIKLSATEAAANVKKLEAEIVALEQKLSKVPTTSGLGFNISEIKSAIYGNRELKADLAAGAASKDMIERYKEAITYNETLIAQQLRKAEIASKNTQLENGKEQLDNLKRRVEAENELYHAKKKLTQASQAQANAEKQAQQGMSQKEIGATIRAAVIEDLKKSLSYISEAKEAIKGDSFTRFTERVNNAVEAINKLTEAFSKFKATIGSNQDLKDLLSGWGAALKEINAAMAAINAAKSSGGGRKKGVSGQSNEEIKQEEQGLIKVASALGQVRSAMGAGGSVNIPWMESITRVGKSNIQTLIKEQGHIERLIAIAKKSIDFGEGHPVLGMGRLRGDQMDNLKGLENLKKSITEILYLVNQGDQKWIHFVNTVGSLRTTPFGKDAMGNDVTLLGGHFDKLTHSVTGTAQAMRTLNNEMRLDSNVWGNSERETAQRRYNQMLVDTEKLLRRLEEAGSKSHGLGLSTTLTNVGSRDVFQFLEKALQFKDMGNFRALNELIGQFSRLKSVYGEVAREQEKMNSKTEKTTTKKTEVMETNQRRYNQALEATVALMNRLEVAGQRGGMLGMDMTKTATALKEAQVFYERMASFGNAKLGDNHAVSELIAGFTNLKIAITPVINQQEKLIAQREKLLGMSAESYAQGKVNLFSNQNTAEIQKQIDAVGALYTQIQRLEQELARAGMAMQTISPTRWDELVKSGLYKKGVSYEAQMAQFRKEQIYPGDMQQQKTVIQENLERLRSLIGAFKAEGLDVSGFKSQLDALFVTFEKFAALQPIDIGRKLGLEHLRGYTGPQSAADDATWASMKRQAEIQEVAGEAAKKHQRKLEELTNAFAQHDAQLAKSRRVQDGDNKARQQSAETLRKQAQELVKARMELLRSQASDLGGLLSKGKNALGMEQYDAVRNALRSIREEMRQLETAMQRINSYSTKELFSLGRGGAMDYSPLISNTQQLVNAKQQANQATQQLTSEQQRLAQALSQSNEKIRGQSQVLSDLKMLATQYLGVWGAQGFLKNIIEIGGQLEMQRLSIGAILQNQSQANTLFNQIKGLATQSPFGVVELDQMTKQLTAYGFKYHELFDMTKRLADISAATGTSVDRLALALGHVRSEAALSGYTLRQFSMGNVPLLQKLSEKLGKTTKEIRDMVKKKEVSYEDVVGVLKDLTNEGGMFYNMQEVISESVKAKFKNVKDAMDIMYGEMAEGGIGDALKGVANVLMELTRNWKDVATVMASVGGSWVFMRTVTMLYTQTLGAANAQTLASIAAHRQKEAAMLRQASIYRTLTTAERSQLATSKLLTTQERLRMMLGKPLTAQQELRVLYARKQQVADLTLALSQQKVTVETISRMVALKRLTMAEAIQIIKEAQLDAQIKATGYSMLNNTKILSGWRLGLAKTQLALSGFGASLKAFFSWPMLLMTAFTAVIELWQRNSREMEAADELANSIYQHSQEAIKNTRTMMQNNEMSIVNANGKGVNTADLNISNISSAKIKFPEIDKGDMQQTIEEWTTYIENYAVNAGQILNNAFFGADGSLLSLEERFNNLKVAIEEVVLAQYGLQDMDVVFSNAVKATDGGWFDDNVMTDIGNYEKKLKSFGANVATTYRKYQKAIDNGVKAAEKQSETFANATKDMDTYAQKFMFLAKYQEEFSDAWKAFGASADTSDAIDRLNFSLFHTTQDDMQNARAEMVEELDAFYAQVTAEMQTKGVDVNNMTKEQQQALLIGYKQQLESIQGLSEETMRWLMKLFAKHFNIPLNLDDSKFVPKVNETTQILDSLVEGDWTVVIKFAEHINDAIDDARKKYKQAKDYFEKANPILLKFGLSAKIGTKLTEEQIKAAVAKAPEFVREALEKALRGWNEMTDIFNKSSEASKALGFSLEDEKKNKKDIDKKKKDAEKAAKKEEDREIKGWKERIRLLKDARSWYDKWEKEVGHSAALEKVQEMFKGLVSKKDIESLEAYEKALDAVIAKAQARRAKNKGKDERAEEVIRQGEDEKAQIAMLKFQRDSTAFTSDFDKEMEQLTRRWEIFNSVLDATGDKLLAVRMAGFQKGDKDFNARNSADSLRNRLDAAMIFPGLDKTIDFDAVSKMSEEDIDKYVKRLLGGTEYENMIGGIAKGLKEWKKLSDDVIKNDIVGYAQLVGAAVDYGTQIQKNNKDFDERKKMLLSLLAIGKISDEHFDEALSQAAAERDYKNYQLSPGYVELMTNASALTRGQVTNAIEGAMARLNDMYDHNLITLQQYREEVRKLDDVRQNWEKNTLFGKNNGLSSYVNGGVSGLRNWLVGKKELYDASGEQKEADKMQEYIDKLDNVSGKLGDFEFIISLVTGTFDGLQRAATALSTMFDALGKEAQANAWGDLADGISAVSSIFAPASGILQSAQRGDVGGIVSNAIAAPFEMIASPITGFAQLHDKRRERQIDELKHEVEKIDDTLNLIRKSRDRSLGYDKGMYRKMMAAMYAGDRSSSGKAMYEYYMRGSNGETGYAQELEALKTQREEYLKMYDKEKSKKKESKEALEEYKQKMAELDDQIMNYTQDLANELWSIDLKGWADQIGDALMNAFENGTSAALAYENAVSDIMRSVVSQMLKVGIIEPMMENLRERLFGENGAFNYNDPSGSMGAVLSELGRFFGKGGEGEQMMTAADEFLTGAEQLLNENYGITMKSSSQPSQTEGIKSQATEETVGILSGQMARIAQDVSVKRIFLTQLVTQQMPTLLERTERQVAMTEVSLQSLRAIEHAVVDGNGAMYDAIYRMSQKIDRAITPDGYMKVQ